MNQINILVISNKVDFISSLIASLSQEPEWNIHPVSSVEAAIELLYRQPFEVVILDKTENILNENKIKAVLNHCTFESIFVKYEYPDALALRKKIKEAMEEKKINGYRHIRVNDTLNPSNLANEIRLIE